MSFAKRRAARQAQNWRTPNYVIRGMEAILGAPFGVDLCAERWNKQADIYFRKGGPSVFKADLAKLPGPFWANPEYSVGQQARWLELGLRWALRGCTTACLVQAKPSEGWWRDFVIPGPLGPARRMREGHWPLPHRGRDMGGPVISFWRGQARIDVCFPRRINFDPPPGWVRKGAMFSSAIVVYRPAPAAPGPAQLTLPLPPKYAACWH